MRLISRHLVRNLACLILQTLLQLKLMFQSSPVVIIMSCFRIPQRRYEFFMVMFFATDEINKNPYILPNMSLLFITNIDLCQDTLGVLDIVPTSENNTEDFINYACGQYPPCDVDLTGPSWKTSLKLTIQSRRTKVRICDTE